MPQVSVLLTCFNHIRYLPACVESVRGQTFRDFEIVAIDDGSTDGTRDWLTQQPDIRTIFNRSNLGTYATLNVGLEAASGEFVAVLNDDDLWAPEKLEHQVRVLQDRPNVALVHTGGGFIDGSGAPLEGNPLGFRFPTFETGDILLGLVYENKIIASAALARRNTLRDLGGFNSAYFGSGDWEMWFRVAEQGPVAFVDRPLTSYRVHGENASHKLERIWRDDEMLREWIVQRLDQLPEGRFAADDLRRAKAFNLAALGTVRTLNGRAAAGREAYRASIELAPKRVKSYLRWAATFLPRKVFRRLL